MVIQPTTHAHAQSPFDPNTKYHLLSFDDFH